MPSDDNTAVSPRRRASGTARAALVRVAPPTVSFWAAKALSTAMGEAASDFLVHVLPPVIAVLCGVALLGVALAVQLRMGRYVPWAYWSAVCAVGVAGTMAADVVHVVLGAPYAVSATAYAAILALVFVLWRVTEHDLSVHAVTNRRRELFYWAAVMATFAMGTALGDAAAALLPIGYAGAAIVFALLILLPAAGYRFWHWNGVFAFWSAYVITRPLGASVADWLAKPRGLGGLDFGDGAVTLVLLLAIAVLVVREQVGATWRGR